MVRHPVNGAHGRCYGKGMDESCAIGPVLVRLGVVDPDNLSFRGVLAGKTMQESNTS